MRNLSDIKYLLKLVSFEIFLKMNGDHVKHLPLQGLEVRTLSNAQYLLRLMLTKFFLDDLSINSICIEETSLKSNLKYIIIQGKNSNDNMKNSIT